MAELRSFLIGVVVAGVLLGIVALALGAFSGEGEEAPTARLLGSPAPSVTPRATEGPDIVVPTVAPTEVPLPTQTPVPESPTPQPTPTPEPQPTADPVSLYLAVAQPAVADLDAQMGYVIGQGSQNPGGSIQSAQIIKDKAAQLQSASPPACLASAHDTLVQAAVAASAAADQLIAALNDSNDSLVQASLANMDGARATLGQGAAAVSSASC